VWSPYAGVGDQRRLGNGRRAVHECAAREDWLTAALYLIVFVSLSLTGPGGLSIDRRLRGRKINRFAAIATPSKSQLATKSVSLCAPMNRWSIEVTITLPSDGCNFPTIVRNKSVRNFRAVTVCLIWACALTIPAHATTIIVTNTNDSGPGSLRQALADTNDGDTIDATSISGVITLTSGQLQVDKSMTINGAGADRLAIDANMASRIFQIGLGQTGETVTISGLTIRNAQGNFGGGIFITTDATATIINCSVSGSSAGFGGGIFNDAALTIANTTISGNIASEGGGTYNNGTLTISNSTFSGNSGQSVGGAIFNDKGTMQVTNSTISNNSAFSGGGILNLGTLEIGNTILKTGASGGNIVTKSGVVTSLGYNLSNDDGGGFLTSTGDQINTDPLLSPLQNNGGSTFTHALLPGSPAIDAGDPTSLRLPSSTSAVLGLIAS
jgi:hypothetical protein